MAHSNPKIVSLARLMDAEGFIHYCLVKSFCIQLPGFCFSGCLFIMVLNKELRSYIECCIISLRAADQGKARAVGSPISDPLAAVLTPELTEPAPYACSRASLQQSCPLHREEGFPARPLLI